MELRGNYWIGRSNINAAVIDGRGRPRNPWEVVFPIVQALNERTWRPIATGFFISNNGLFATAKHVLIDNHDQILPELYGLHTNADLSNVDLRQIIKLRAHPQADVAVGFLFDPSFASGSQTTNPMLRLTTALPKAGDRVVSYGYPDSTFSELSDGSQMLLRGSPMDGQFVESHPEGRDRVLLPGPCFRTSMMIPSGASGGPVVSEDGGVFGINSTGIGGTDIGYLSPVSALLEINLFNIQLLDGAIRDRISIAELADLGLLGFDRG